MGTAEDWALVARVADGLPTGVWIGRASDRETTYANRALKTMLGVDANGAASIVARAAHAWRTRTMEQYPEDRLPFARVLHGEEIVQVDDLVFQRPDKGEVFVRAVAWPLRDGEGRMSHVAVAFQDATAEVAAKHHATDVEATLRGILNHAPVCLFAFNALGVCTHSAGRGLEMQGWQPQDFVGQCLFDVYRDQPNVVQNLRRAIAGESFTSVDDLGSVAFETAFTPVRDEKGAVVSVIGVAIDITERLRMQSRLLQAERVATMGTLAASVGHEINNPLTYVLSNIDLAARKLREGDAHEARDELLLHLESAREGAEQMRRIVRALRSTSRADVAPPGPTDVHAVLDRAIQLVRHEILPRARLVKAYEAQGCALADPVQLSQVIVNLLANAAQSIPEGEASRHEIAVRTRLQPGQVVIEVSDTGAGIPKELRSRIFEPFFTTKRSSEGTGLGLAVSASIVQSFGGRIEVDSDVGKGSTFRVFLLASEATAGPMGSSPAPPVDRRARVLIIDDEPRVAESLRLLLEPDHDAEVAPDAAAAYERLVANESFDVIFCDLMMPDLDGVDLYLRLKERAPEQAAKLVFMTGGAFTRRAQEFLARVPNVRIEKPFRLADLHAAIRMGLERVSVDGGQGR